MARSTSGTPRDAAGSKRKGHVSRRLGRVCNASDRAAAVPLNQPKKPGPRDALGSSPLIAGALPRPVPFAIRRMAASIDPATVRVRFPALRTALAKLSAIRYAPLILTSNTLAARQPQIYDKSGARSNAAIG